MPDYGRPIEFGIFLDPAAAQSATVLDTIALIDELGFDWIGIQDHPYNRQQLDAMTLIGSWLGPLGLQTLTNAESGELQIIGDFHAGRGHRKGD